MTGRLTLDFIQVTPEKEILEQKNSFKSLLQKLGQAAEIQIKSTLAERELVKPEEELTLEITTRLQQRMGKSK
jgi:hypothetical protein